MKKKLIKYLMNICFNCVLTALGKHISFNKIILMIYKVSLFSALNLLYQMNIDLSILLINKFKEGYEKKMS